MRILIALLLFSVIGYSQEMWVHTNFESTNEWQTTLPASPSAWRIANYGPPAPWAWGAWTAANSKPARLNLVGNAREGAFALAVNIIPTDYRNEIGINADAGSPGAVRDPKDARFGITFFDEFWMGYSMKIVDLADEGNWNIMSQVRGYANNLSGTVGKTNFFTMQAVGNNLRLGFSTNPNAATIIPNGCAVCDQIYYDDYLDGTPILYQLGEWIDIVMHFVLDWDSDGLLEVWVNGKKVVNIPAGPTVYRLDAAGLQVEPYMNRTLGIYTGNNGTGEVHYDAYRLWKGPGSYQIVAPGAGNLPTPGFPSGQKSVLAGMIIPVLN